MTYQKLSFEQIKVMNNATQLFGVLEAHRLQAGSVAGSMHWKTINNRQYLYRAYSYGKNKSLGVKNKKTESIKQQFDQNRQRYKEREASLVEQLKLHASYIKANRLNRFPLTAARIIRAFGQQNIPYRVIGTNALYVYEGVAGVMFQADIVATEDIDLLMDAQQGVKIIANLQGESLLSVLKKTDKTFEKLTANKFEFTAANAKGYQVDFITQGCAPMEVDVFEALLQQDDCHPVSVDSLKWYIASPHYDAIVFDEQGFPVRIQSIDPRAFVLHKWFVSQQADRSRVKQLRDRAQANAVVIMLKNELRHLATSSALSKVFPNDIQQKIEDDMDGFSV